MCLAQYGQKQNAEAETDSSYCLQIRPLGQKTKISNQRWKYQAVYKCRTVTEAGIVTNVGAYFVPLEYVSYYCSVASVIHQFI